MGNKQSTSKSIRDQSNIPTNPSKYEYENDLIYNAKNLRAKRRLNPNKDQLNPSAINRSTSSPLITKCRPNSENFQTGRFRWYRHVDTTQMFFYHLKESNLSQF